MLPLAAAASSTDRLRLAAALRSLWVYIYDRGHTAAAGAVRVRHALVSRPGWRRSTGEAPG
jgi:hypothetical protein